jgi:GNAT superfamily N-acetyltransferase
MIACFNRLVRIVARQGRIPRRIVEIITNYCWMRTAGFWLFDLTRPGDSWRRFREQQDSIVRWELATVENCRRWSKSGADGFSSYQCELLIRLIEEKHLVLVGYLNDSDNGNLGVPDCYATLAFGRKPMTEQCSFYTEPDEGTIRTVYTRERSRGRGLATQIYAELCSLAEERGLTKVYVDIDFSNVASIRAAEKAGGILMRGVAVYYFVFFKRAYLFFAQGSLKNRLRHPIPHSHG